MTDAEKTSSRLGRGLDALFGDDKPALEQENTTPQTSNDDDLLGSVVVMPVDLIKAGQFQPRQNFDNNKIEELSQSIAKHGVLQPLLVRKIGEDQFEIIAGERRWRAAQKANLHEVPVIIQNFDDQDALEIGLIENLQREDLNAVEEAQAYKKLMGQFGHTQERLSEIIGKSRSHIANTLRLLNLPPFVQDKLASGELSAGHARTLLGHKDPVALAKRAIKDNLNVRQLEKLVYGGLGKGKTTAQKSSAQRESSFENGQKAKSADVRALEKEVQDMLGLKVEVNTDSTGEKGSLTVHYDNLDQFDELLRRLAG